MQFSGFDWDSGNLPKCLGHGVALVEIEALFARDVYIVRDTLIAGERRMLGFGEVAGRWIFACSLGEAKGFDPSAHASCTRKRSSAMSKRFPDWKTETEADDWLQGADLADYDLSGMKKVQFELAPKDASISLRLPAGLLAMLKARAAAVRMPTQRFIRVLIEAQLGAGSAKSKRKAIRGSARSRKRAA